MGRQLAEQAVGKREGKPHEHVGLCIRRRRQERVRLELPGGQKIWVTVVHTGSNAVKLGFDAPGDVAVFRDEVAT